MITVMLASIAVVLVIGHGAEGSGAALTGIAQIVAGVIAGFGIGFIASLLGVAGGELLIPTLVLLFGVDIKLEIGSSNNCNTNSNAESTRTTPKLVVNPPQLPARGCEDLTNANGFEAYCVVPGSAICGVRP
jgi:hypothetical protein